MRIAIVSPYSWTYAGGVNRHVEALAEEFLARGHEVRVLAPWDPPDRLSRVLHRAARRTARDARLPGAARAHGRASAPTAPSPTSASSPAASTRRAASSRRRLRRRPRPRAGAPLIGWDAALAPSAPVVGTFHSYSTKPLPNCIANALGARRKFNQLSARIAVSEAAAWTGRRWFGGDYR